MLREEEQIRKMLDTKEQIYRTNSWKRRRDLEKSLKKLEKEWFEYKSLRSD